MRGRGTAAGVGLLAALLFAGLGAAEQAWVRGAPLNLRTGPSTQHRILATVEPGAGLEVSERSEGWVHVRTAAGEDGWIPAGYLAAEAPPAERLQELEGELAALRSRLDRTGSERDRLAADHERLAGADADQRVEIERLTRENLRLRAGERWFEWITGALLLCTGMVLGAILSRVSGRRRSRLRL
jgi:SH3 domain protein